MYRQALKLFFLILVDQLKSEKTRILTCWKNHVNTFHLQITSAKSDISDDFNGNQMLRRSTESVAATWPTSIFTQIRVLAARNFREARPKMLSKLNWLQTIALAIMSGLVWHKVKSSTTLQSNQSIFYNLGHNETFA